MIERNPVLTISCHIILIVGAPLYFAFVAGSNTGDAMRAVSKPLLPGNEFLANVKVGWEKFLWPFWPVLRSPISGSGSGFGCWFFG